MKVLLRVAAVLIVVLFGLLLAEAALRVLNLVPAEGLATVAERDFDEVPGIYSPGQELVDRRNPHLSHRVRINRLGYRGPEIASDRFAVPYRLLLLGDSFTYGDFVDDEEALPARLEALLSKRCPGVEVINAGVPGSGIVTQKAMFERGLILEPDHVILVFSVNDITDLIPPTPWERLAANRRAKSRFPLSVVYPVARRTALWNLGLRARAQMRARETPRPPDTEATGNGVMASPDPDPGPVEGEARPAGDADRRHDELRQEYLERLLRLHERTRQLDLPFHLVVYPSHHSVSGPPLDDEVWIVEEARRAGIPTVDILPDFLERGMPVDSLYLLPLDGHPSPAGYAAAAGALEEKLDLDEVLKNCPRIQPTGG